MSPTGSFDLSQLRDAFLSALTDQNRLLSGQLSGLDVPLNLQRLEGSEGIDEGLSYTLDLLAQTQATPQSLLGKWVHIELKTQAGMRTFSALAIGAKKLGTQGALSRYHLTLGTGLDVLRHRKTWRVFLNQTALQVCESIIQEHKSKNSILAESFFIESHLLNSLPERPFVMQAGESDAEFMRRILARDGIHWIIDPSQKGKHAWHLFDDLKALDDLHKQKPIIAFHDGSLVETEDVLTSWEHRGEVQGQMVSNGRWNPEDARIEGAVRWKKDGQANAEPSPFGESLEHYIYTGEDANYQQHAQTQMDALESPGIQARGPVRNLAAGQVFVLRRNSFLNPGDDKGHRVISWRFSAENNLPHALSEAFHLPFANENPTGKTPFAAEFHCIGAQKVLPSKTWEAPRVGMLSAKAVGPKGQAVYTDALGRICVRFLFTRPEEHPQGGASDTDADSAWVRFSQPWASEGFGALFLPRAGDEVLVGFLQNDPDQPIVMGGLYNERTWPASFTKSSVLPGDAAISGFRSRMLPGGEGGQATNTGNELLLDDTANELRARLASDHADSQLNLGAIVAPRRQGQAQPRGDGFELKTQESGALRAHKGLLITTEIADAKAPQLEITSLTSKLESAQSLTQTLKEACENHQALPLNEKPLQQGIQDLQALQEKKSAKIPAFSKPHLSLDSSADILSAAQNQHHVATENLAFSSGKDTQLSTGGRILMAAKEAFSLFAAKSGIKLFAGKGNVDIQAHEGQIGIVADQDIKITSCQKSVNILAKEEIILVAGGAKVELKSGNLTFTMPGTFTVKAKMIDMKPQGEQAALAVPDLPKGGLGQDDRKYSDRLHLGNPLLGEPLKNEDYCVLDPKGNLIAQGKTDEKGRTERWFSEGGTMPYTAWIGGGPWGALINRLPDPLAHEPGHSDATTDKIDNQTKSNPAKVLNTKEDLSKKQEAVSQPFWNLRVVDKSLNCVPNLKVFLKIDGSEKQTTTDGQGFIGNISRSDNPIEIDAIVMGIRKSIATLTVKPDDLIEGNLIKITSPYLVVKGMTAIHKGEPQKAQKAKPKQLHRSKAKAANTAPTVERLRNDNGHPVKKVEIGGEYVFPLKVKPRKGYKNEGPFAHEGRWFGAPRDNGRKHAGCDLLAPKGTPVYAMMGGTVISPLRPFWKGTYDLEIRHDNGVVIAYRELAKTVVPGLSKGARTEKGQLIGYLTPNTKNKSCMLHIEMFQGNIEGSTILAKRPSNGPYWRRKDLIDPTPILDAAEFLG